MYKWCGDSKLYIPGLVRINPGELFEMGEEQMSLAGVQSLIAEKQIVKQESVKPRRGVSKSKT